MHVISHACHVLSDVLLFERKTLLLSSPAVFYRWPSPTGEIWRTVSEDRFLSDPARQAKLARGKNDPLAPSSSASRLRHPVFSAGCCL